MSQRVEDRVAKLERQLNALFRIVRRQARRWTSGGDDGDWHYVDVDGELIGTVAVDESGELFHAFVRPDEASRSGPLGLDEEVEVGEFGNQHAACLSVEDWWKASDREAGRSPVPYPYRRDEGVEMLKKALLEHSRKGQTCKR